MTNATNEIKTNNTTSATIFESIELFNESRLSVASFRKLGLFGMRKYINTCIDNVNHFEADETKHIVKPTKTELLTNELCEKYCEEHNFFKKTATSSDNKADNKEFVERKAVTFAEIDKLISIENKDRYIETKNADGELIPRVIYQYSEAHENKRCIFKVFDPSKNDYKNVFTLFLAVKYSNVTIKDESVTDILENFENASYYDKVKNHSFLKYSQKNYVKELEFDTFADVKKLVKQADGKKREVTERVAEHKELFELVRDLLVINSGILEV